ncbi:hypothetical protein HRbin36_01827 [bacterium HR36]|nr:hypothetical protein HRbin36_01827 [bacterium HR36]
MLANLSLHLLLLFGGEFRISQGAHFFADLIRFQTGPEVKLLESSQFLNGLSGNTSRQPQRIEFNEASDGGEFGVTFQIRAKQRQDLPRQFLRGFRLPGFRPHSLDFFTQQHSQDQAEVLRFARAVHPVIIGTFGRSISGEPGPNIVLQSEA